MYPSGGDKGREKKNKSSKSAKSSKKRSKYPDKSPNALNASYTEPLKGSTDSLNASGKSLDTSVKTDISIERSSDDTSIASGEILSTEKVKSDEDYKSADDFHADCSNLTGYLETAMLESACNTLERDSKNKATGSKLKPQSATPFAENMTTAADGEAARGHNKYPPSLDEDTSSYDTKLLVEYVNYDLLMVGDVIRERQEYFSSDEDGDDKVINFNNNSNHETTAETAGDDLLRTDSTANVHAQRQDKANSDGITASLQKTQASTVNSAFYNRNETAASHENTTELSEKRIASDPLNRDETMVSGSANDNASRDSHSQEQPAKFSAENQIVVEVVTDHYRNNERHNEGISLQAERCPIHNEYGPDVNTIGDISNMEKARSIFGRYKNYCNRSSLFNSSTGICTR